VVGTPSAAKQVTAVVAFKPRNAILLHGLAMRSTARPGMSNAEIDRLFAPTPATVAAVRSYLNANGLSVVDSTDMSLVVSGTAAARPAFGVSASTRRAGHVSGTVGNVRLPKDRLVAVGGGSIVSRAASANREARKPPDTAARFVPHSVPVAHGGLDSCRRNSRRHGVRPRADRRRGGGRQWSGSSSSRIRPATRQLRTLLAHGFTGANPTTVGGDRSQRSGRGHLDLGLRWALRQTPNRRSTKPPITWRSPDDSPQDADDALRRLGQLEPLRTLRADQADG
jgi:hypothetical protein